LYFRFFESSPGHLGDEVGFFSVLPTWNQKLQLNPHSCGVSHRTIERLVEAGLLKRAQVTPRAPWKIRRADLNDEPIRSVIERLLRTGKLVLQGQ
jgi:hypothetical protein